MTELPAGTSLGAIRLRVGDIDRMRTFVTRRFVDEGAFDMNADHHLPHQRVFLAQGDEV